MQWMPDVVEAEPYALSADTKRLLESAGYSFKEKTPWGQAAGIVTNVLGQDGSPNGLAIPYLAKPPKPMALYGADDDRDPVGSAAGY